MRRAADRRIPVTFEGFYADRGEWRLASCYPFPSGGLATQSRDINGGQTRRGVRTLCARATQTLSSSLDYETTLRELAKLVVPDFADWAAVDVVGRRRKTRATRSCARQPGQNSLGIQLDQRYPPDPNASTGVYNVLRTGRPEFYPEIPEEMFIASAVDDEHMKINRELGLKSAIVAPLIAEGRTLGALTLVSAESGRRYAEADLGADELAVALHSRLITRACTRRKSTRATRQKRPTSPRLNSSL